MNSRSRHRVTGAALLVGGLILGAGNFLYPYLAARNHLLAWNLCVAVPLSLCIAVLARSPRVWPMRAVWLVPACLLASFAVEAAAESWWPNSADEYGYVFLARTLLHGRLWNAPPPAPEIFEIFWTYVRDGKWFSQYPPAWPALLAPFLAVDLAWLVNPLLTAGLCALMLRVLRLLRVDAAVAIATTFMLAFSPFVLFNGASLFPHTLTAVLIIGVVLLQAREELAGNRIANRLGIGALFGMLLLTRYDVFVLAAVPFVLDRLWFRRAAFLRDALAMALGGLPFIACYVLYNRAITGRPFETPYAWASGGAHIGLWDKHVALGDAVGAAVLRTAHWGGELAAFGSPALLALAALAVVAKLRARNLRWFDVLLPAAVVFFFFYPATGGHEFGPRYWFFAWPGTMLTIATGLSGAEPGWLRTGRWRLHAPTLAAAHAPLFLGMCLSTAAFTHLYVDQRRIAEGMIPPQTPAVVLIPTRSLMLTRWQSVGIIAYSADFCRNGVDLDADVLYARADADFDRAPDFVASACAFTGRHVYLWHAPGVLEAVRCR